MSTENSRTEGTRLSRADKKHIRAEVVREALRTGRRAYQFAWDGEQKVQVTGFPNGRATQEPVDDEGYSLEPRRLLTALGVPARYIGIGTAALALVAEVLRAVLSG